MVCCEEVKRTLLSYDLLISQTASFEVSIDSNEVHSKLKTMSFPDFDEVAEITSDVAEGKPTRQVTNTESSGCQVM